MASAATGKKPVKEKAVNGSKAKVRTESEQEDTPRYNDKDKPDKAAFDAEQDRIAGEIKKLQDKMTALKAKISQTQGGKNSSPDGVRRQELRGELDTIRSQQREGKGARDALFDAQKNLSSSIQKQIKELQAAKGKVNFKSVAEIDARINDLERRVESGNMSLVDEKKALAEVSTLRRSRKQFDTFANQQASIDADKQKLDSTKAQVDGSSHKALSDRYNAIKAELDEINKREDERHAGVDKLYDERTTLSKEIDDLYTQKKDSAREFKEANDRWFTKVKEEKQKRWERQQAERAEYEAAKRKEHNQKLLDEASAPAYQREIEDCSTMIDLFNRRLGIQSTAGTIASNIETALSGVASLVIRKVDEVMPEGAKVLKKKGDEETFFMGSGGKKGKKGGSKKASTSATPETPSESATPQALNLPFQTVGALLQLGVDAPMSHADLPKTIAALTEKKEYFQANQERVTKERVAAAQAKINGVKTSLPAKDAAPINEDATADAPDDNSVPEPTKPEAEPLEEGEITPDATEDKAEPVVEKKEETTVEA